MRILVLLTVMVLSVVFVFVPELCSASEQREIPIVVDGREIEGKATILDNRAFLPLDLMSDIFRFKCEWDLNLDKVIIDTQTLVTPPPGQVLFEDTFDNDKMRPEWEVLGGDWTIVDGVWRPINVTEGQVIRLSVGPNTWKDYAVDLDLVGPRDGGHVVIALRHESIDDWIGLAVERELYGSKFHWLRKRQGKVDEPIDPQRFSSAERHHIRVEVRGDQVSAMVGVGNSSRWRYGDLRPGHLAIFIIAKGIRAYSCIDRIKVTSL